MTEPTITCPNCKTEIPLTETLAGPLLQSTRKQFEKELAQKDADIATRENSTRDKERKLVAEQAKLDEKVDDLVQKQVDEDRIKITAEADKKAKKAVSIDLDQKVREVADLQEVLKGREEKLAKAQKSQSELLKKQRELDDAKREMDLTIEKRVQDTVGEVRQKAKKEAEDGLNLKVKEKEEQIASMQRQIEDLSRKAEQGSQQLQGEAMELALEDILRSKFPLDSIEPVPKGEFGGDVIHRVSSPAGAPCGTILWESKRTKNWSDSWLVKLRNDQRTAKAEISILISQTMPKDIDSFVQTDGVWICAPQFAVPLVIALRQTLIEVANSKQAQVGQHTKTEMVYQYLTGPQFRHRVEAIVEAFSTMQHDLDKERKVILKQWAKREKQIERVIGATAGMYGDLQGIAGQSVLEIDGLELDILSLEGDD